jgi:fimbrial chaperone protein
MKEELTTVWRRLKGARWARHGLILATAWAWAWPAGAELSLFPTRIVLEKNQRSAQVELLNRGSAPETYRISLVNRRMTVDGDIVPADKVEPDERFAESMLRYSPRQVTLQPGQSQTVRVLLRKPAELDAGEYRSHLQFDRVEDSSAATSIEAAASAPVGGGIGVVIRALVGASIPVIVRHGDTQTRVTLSDLALETDPASSARILRLQFDRQGNRSVYGDLRVTFTAAGRAAVEVGRAFGVAVYVPNPLRKARLQLEAPPGVGLTGGVLHVTFRERPEAGGALLAEARLALP